MVLLLRERVNPKEETASFVRSCAMDSKAQKSTQDLVKIPSGQIPLIILHWMHEHYRGGGFTIRDMRVFLEAKLREGTFTRGAVVTWINQSEAWASQIDPSKVNNLLAEYLEIKIAA